MKYVCVACMPSGIKKRMLAGKFTAEKSSVKVGSPAVCSSITRCRRGAVNSCALKDGALPKIQMKQKARLPASADDSHERNFN